MVSAYCTYKQVNRFLFYVCTARTLLYSAVCKKNKKDNGLDAKPKVGSNENGRYCKSEATVEISCYLRQLIIVGRRKCVDEMR